LLAEGGALIPRFIDDLLPPCFDFFRSFSDRYHPECKVFFFNRSDVHEKKNVLLQIALADQKISLKQLCEICIVQIGKARNAAEGGDDVTLTVAILHQYIDVRTADLKSSPELSRLFTLLFNHVPADSGTVASLKQLVRRVFALLCGNALPEAENELLTLIRVPEE